MVVVLAILPAAAGATPVPDPVGILPPHAPPAARRAWAAGQSGLCLVAAGEAEARLGLPRGTLGAIARVETGVVLPVTGDVEPWPWTVNGGGTGHWYPTRAAAAREAALLLARTGMDVDVGCMQVSMRYHRDAFASLADALDPAINVRFGAALLRGLAGGRRDVRDATGRYHSGTPALGDPYRERVGRMRQVQRSTLADATASRR